jgi:hypothetical protein
MEHVFALLQGDTATLHACALVCSSLTLISQEQLLRRISLIEVRRGRTPVSYRWDRLLSCLTSFPHLRPRIRSLAVEGPRNADLATHAVDLGVLFPRVSTLELSGVLQLTLILALNILIHLRFQLSGLPIRRSRTGDLNFNIVWDGVVPPSAPILRTLEVSGPFAEKYQEHVLSWIESTGVASDIESAVFACRWQTQHWPIRHLAALLHGCRPSLRRLVLNLGWIRGECEPSTVPQLSDADDIVLAAQSLVNVPHVEELKITALPSDTAFPAILAFLRTTCFPSLRALEVEIAHEVPMREAAVYRATPSTGALAEWALPDDVLSRLQRVRLAFRNIDVIYDLGHILSVFGLDGMPGVVEVDLGSAISAESTGEE